MFTRQTMCLRTSLVLAPLRGVTQDNTNDGAIHDKPAAITTDEGRCGRGRKQTNKRGDASPLPPDQQATGEYYAAAAPLPVTFLGVGVRRATTALDHSRRRVTREATLGQSCFTVHSSCPHPTSTIERPGADLTSSRTCRREQIYSEEEGRDSQSFPGWFSMSTGALPADKLRVALLNDGDLRAEQPM